MSLAALRNRIRVPDGQIGILVTETTRMNGGKICVAGVRLDNARCVRPLQWNGDNWRDAQSPAIFQVGALIVGTVRPAQEPGPLPHRREDLRLSTDPARTGAAMPRELFDTVASLAHATVQESLGIEPHEGGYVLEGSDCASLFALRVRANQAMVKRVERDDGKKQTRCEVLEFDFPVTALGQDDDQAVAALTETLTRLGRQEIVLRCGLARPWNRHTPQRCYIQVNGFILPPNP